MPGDHEGQGRPIRLERRLACDEDAPRFARAMVSEVTGGMDDTAAANLYLAMSELVTNAVIHGPTEPITVVVEHSGQKVRLEVSDAGVLDVVPDGSHDRVHGLDIVEAFTNRYGIDRRPNTVAWCELDLDD